jgi:hypothetical protein
MTRSGTVGEYLRITMARLLGIAVHVELVQSMLTLTYIHEGEFAA